MFNGIFEEIPIDSATRDELIEAFQRFCKTAIPKLMSPRGVRYLKQRHGEFDQQRYLSGLLDTKERSFLRMKKLENNKSFSLKFVDNLKLTFESIFIEINSLCNLYDDKKFCEEQKKQFDKFKTIYKKIYPNSTFNFEDLLNGKSPYK